MLEFIANPRRALRATARCRARVIAATATFEAATEDVGSHGCQVIAPRSIRRGEPLRVTLSDARVKEPLAVAGRVAWASEQAPWRLGIAFDEGQVRSGARFVGELLQAYPGLTPVQRVPARIPLETTVYLAAPPRLLVDFTREEVTLLRAVASGARIDELLARFREEWPEAQRALFSLLARQHVTLSRGAAVHPESWRTILAHLEGVLAARALEDLPPPRKLPDWARAPATPTATATSTRADSTPVRPERSEAAPAAERSRRASTPSPATRTPPPAPSARATARALDGGAGWVETPRPTPARGWRAPGAATRGTEAQGCFDRAKVEAGRGQTSGAILLLRRALTLAPGDPEIAEMLGRLSFKDRNPYHR